LFHFFVASGERGFHDFSGDGVGESSKKEVGAFVVSCGILCESEQLFERGYVCIDVWPFHSVVVERGSGSLLLRRVLEFLLEFSFEVLPEGWHVIVYGV